ncbi:DUF1127 domain-containing protein [Tropicimonas sp. TH_r6]|uniref:DUF1127 domain-containing protein n=1 Tax=Tropicimonas sp. TH_r6 TaxID=3082085 RepID=UPI00295415D0|nr:DUF1127 domain-containing protein [Tropicimonas sp. TH_r6]MDV7142626.1 DUF1127 domain-containing protein [Tropicimonas sp. TH_r6]
MEIAATTNRVETGLQASGLVGMVEGLRTKLRQVAAYHQTMSELKALDERDLRDLGLSRAMFPELAREAARTV